MRKLFVLSVILIVLFNGCKITTPLPTYELYLFDSSSIGLPPWKKGYERIHQPEDPDWRYNIPWDQNSYTRDNIELTDEGVRIWARNGKQGALRSNFGIKYGVIQAMIKLPREEGLHSAFWMFDGLPELDVFEHCGGKDYVNVTHHWGYNYDKKQKKATTRNRRRHVDPYSWNIYEVEMLAESTIYRINGHVVRHIRKGPNSRDQHILFTTGWSDYCPCYNPKEGFMTVKWVLIKRYK